MSDRDRVEYERLLEKHGCHRVIEIVGPYLTDPRRQRIESVLVRRMLGVQVAIESPSNPHNAAAVVRTCEALGAGGIHVIAAEGRALEAQATTQGAFRWIETHAHAALDDFLAWVRMRGLVLVGAHVRSDMDPTRIPVDRPLCLVFGNEQRGLSAEAVEACRYSFAVPMVGMSESLNLSVSAAICLYEVLRARRAYLGQDGDLEGEELYRWRALYYLNSVEPRLARGLLERPSE